MGYAADIQALAEIWRQPQLWTRWCSQDTHAEQCVATRIMLSGNASIELDVHEALFASGAVAKPRDGEMGRLNPRVARIDTCGDVPCRSSRRLEWLRDLDGSLVRPPGYRDACSLLDSAPLLLHFSGAHRALMRDPIMMAWLARQGL